MIPFTFTSGLIVGALLSGVACVLSSKYLGWFNKQVQAIKTDVAAKV